MYAHVAGEKRWFTTNCSIYGLFEISAIELCSNKIRSSVSGIGMLTFAKPVLVIAFLTVDNSSAKVMFVYIEMVW